jgi:predicted dienelactone hydrolase
MKKILGIAIVGLMMSGVANAVDNRVDGMRPDAPALAKQGDYGIGVRTVKMINKDEIDILNVEAGKPLPRYDRPLTVEIWYPADGDEVGGQYNNVYLRDGKTQVTLYGLAVRNEEPLKADAPYPLVIISHGYPGNRFLMSHFGENLASKGYIAVSIDHTDSTYDNKAAFGSTLVNRALDQNFVLNAMEQMNKDSGSFLYNMIDTSNTGLIGYSMGGYGAVITAGGGVTKASTEYTWGAPAGTLELMMAGTDSHEALIDDRFKAIVAIGPWGMNTGFWDAEGLAGVRKPMMFIAGSEDETSLYEKGVRALYQGSVNADRYLLTFISAGHNAAAPIPAPKESWAPVDNLDFFPFEHYADPVWDTQRMNNIAQHFITAYFNQHLKGDDSAKSYLDVIEVAEDGVYAVEKDGTVKPEHTYWKGFGKGKAKGLKLEHSTPK